MLEERLVIALWYSQKRHTFPKKKKKNDSNGYFRLSDILENIENTDATWSFK